MQSVCKNNVNILFSDVMTSNYSSYFACNYLFGSGLPMAGGLNPEEQPYKYGNFEFDTMHGLNQSDALNRFVMHDLVRTPTFDPLAEARPWESPYSWCGNNLVRNIDPTGLFYTHYIDDTGQTLYKTDDGLSDIIVVPDKNIGELENKLNEAHNSGTINDPAKNKEEMHTLGNASHDYSEQPTKGMGDYWSHGYKETYDEAYKNGTSQFSIGQIVSSFVAAIATDNKDNSGEMRHGGRVTGISDGNYDRQNGKINRLNPYSSLKNNDPLLKIPTPTNIKNDIGIGRGLIPK